MKQWSGTAGKNLIRNKDRPGLFVRVWRTLYHPYFLLTVVFLCYNAPPFHPVFLIRSKMAYLESRIKYGFFNHRSKRSKFYETFLKTLLLRDLHIFYSFYSVSVFMFVQKRHLIRNSTPEKRHIFPTCGVWPAPRSRRLVLLLGIPLSGMRAEAGGQIVWNVIRVFCSKLSFSLAPCRQMCYIDNRKGESQRHTAYPQIITTTVLHSRSLLRVVGGYFLPLNIW